MADVHTHTHTHTFTHAHTHAHTIASVYTCNVCTHEEEERERDKKKKGEIEIQDRQNQTDKPIEKNREFTYLYSYPPTSVHMNITMHIPEEKKIPTPLCRSSSRNNSPNRPYFSV